MVRDRLVFPYQTLNSSFKISINVSSIQKSYPSELLTHTFFKLISKFKQQHSQKLFWILWISNSFQNSTKLVQFHIFVGCSDLPGSRFWPDTCGMLQEQKVQDRKFREMRGNISILSVHTDKYFDLEGTTLCPRKVAVPGSLQCLEGVKQSLFRHCAAIQEHYGFKSLLCIFSWFKSKHQH